MICYLNESIMANCRIAPSPSNNIKNPLCNVVTEAKTDGGIISPFPRILLLYGVGVECIPTEYQTVSLFFALGMMELVSCCSFLKWSQTNGRRGVVQYRARYEVSEMDFGGRVCEANLARKACHH